MGSTTRCDAQDIGNHAFTEEDAQAPPLIKGGTERLHLPAMLLEFVFILGDLLANHDQLVLAERGALLVS